MAGERTGDVKDETLVKTNTEKKAGSKESLIADPSVANAQSKIQEEDAHLR